MMNLSPMITPELGSPSAVYAQQWTLSCSKVIFLSTRSAWLANALDTMGLRAGLLYLIVIDYGMLNLRRASTAAAATDSGGWHASATTTRGSPAGSSSAANWLATRL